MGGQLLRLDQSAVALAGDGNRSTTWWEKAQHDFDNARATSFYRYLLPAFRDLYGVDFDTITTEQARELNDRIFANYQDDHWLVDVVTKRANIELMFIDPYWNRLQFAREYQFSVPVLNVTEIMRGSHPRPIRSPTNDSPSPSPSGASMQIETLDDYLAVIDADFRRRRGADAVCLKSTQAYQRTLRYEHVPKERAAAVFGKPPTRDHARGAARTSRTSCSGTSAASARSTSCRFRSTPARPASRARTRCCWWT